MGRVLLCCLFCLGLFCFCFAPGLIWGQLLSGIAGLSLPPLTDCSRGEGVWFGRRRLGRMTAFCIGCAADMDQGKVAPLSPAPRPVRLGSVRPGPALSGPARSAPVRSGPCQSSPARSGPLALRCLCHSCRADVVCAGGGTRYSRHLRRGSAVAPTVFAVGLSFGVASCRVAAHSYTRRGWCRNGCLPCTQPWQVFTGRDAEFPLLVREGMQSWRHVCSVHADLPLYEKPAQK